MQHNMVTWVGVCGWDQGIQGGWGGSRWDTPQTNRLINRAQTFGANPAVMMLMRQEP